MSQAYDEFMAALEEAEREYAREKWISQLHAAILENKDHLPYPWCRGNPTKEDCRRHGYCRRDPNCGE